jgi:glucosamine--fructose-6-phosphate aminotransferase (isomerizing)
LTFDTPSLAREVSARGADALFVTVGACRRPRRRVDVHLFVYKAAAEIGELGDNTAVLRAMVVGGRSAASRTGGRSAEAVVLGHTRWASVGIVSEVQCPSAERRAASAEAMNPMWSAALNGDVDNYADLIATEALRIPKRDHDRRQGDSFVDGSPSGERRASDRRVPQHGGGVRGFRSNRSVHCRGSRSHPTRAAGSGQALYIGLADDAFIVASEPYGVVEDTAIYLRMDGETPGNSDNPQTSRGQIVELDTRHAGSIEGITRQSYDGTLLPVTAAELE